MKNYKKSSVRVSIGLILLYALILTGCTKKFEARNTDITKLSTLSPADVKGLFTSAEFAAMNMGPNTDYQQAQNLFADVYCQYFACTQTAFQTDRFAQNEQFLKYQWNDTYVRALPPLVSIINQTTTANLKALNAIARIWKVFILHRATDYYGPIPYSKIGINDITVPYDNQKDIYYDFFKELTEATADLKANLTQPGFGASDAIFKGDNTKWLKFGNSLRLRLALRISKIDPAKAKTEAEAAVAGGVMTAVADDAYLQPTVSNPNGLGRISDWNEFRMSATMESVLNGYNDPRRPRLFEPAQFQKDLKTPDNVNYRGVRNGMSTLEQVLPDNSYLQASNLNIRYRNANQATEPLPVMRAGESYFLRAEGAVNGWAMGGTASDFYASGIDMNMRANGITDATVISNYTNGTTLPSAPGGYFNTPALTNIPVTFSTVVAEQREQIGTQKWLSLWPDGFEAWAEIRRTGYPKRYNVINSENPDVPVGKFPRRVVFLSADKDLNGPAVTAAVALLGTGGDKASTPIWWDTNP